MNLPSVLRFVAAAGMTVWTATALADSEARVWLERMTRGAESISYRGTFIYQHAGRVDAMRIVHAVGEQGEREKLFSLTGPKREVIRDNEVVTCILADQQSVVVNKSRPRAPAPVRFPKDIGAIENHYRFELDGEDRVAGRPCRLVVLVPRDSYRYGRRLCLDEQNNLLLRSELTDNQGQVIELVMYTEIEFPPAIDAADLKPNFDGSGYRWVRQPDIEKPMTPASAGDSDWVVGSLPDGFMLMDHMRHRITQTMEDVDHWVFGDGLASVSVYIEKARPGENSYTGVSSRGGLNAYGTMLDGHYVTVVGEVPLATLELIGKSVTRKN